MPRYIDAEKLVGNIKTNVGGTGDFSDGVHHEIFYVLGEVKDAPTEDVAPVLHGEWYQRTYMDEDWNCYTCSACDADYVLISDTPEENNYNFCPNCGAKMGGTNDEIRN